MNNFMLILLLVAIVGGLSGFFCLVMASKKRGDGAVGWGYMAAIILIVTIVGIFSVHQRVKADTHTNDIPHQVSPK